MNQSLQANLLSVMPLAVATGLFVSSASFSQPPTAQSPTGNPTGSWTPVNGLQNIACMSVPESMRVVAANEKRAVTEIEAGQYQHVLLSGCYPQVKTAAGLNWRVTVDGTLYTLLGADIDSQSTQTRCRIQEVTV